MVIINIINNLIVRFLIILINLYRHHLLYMLHFEKV